MGMDQYITLTFQNTGDKEIRRERRAGRGELRAKIGVEEAFGFSRAPTGGSRTTASDSRGTLTPAC